MWGSRNRSLYSGNSSNPSAQGRQGAQPHTWRPGQAMCGVAGGIQYSVATVPASSPDQFCAVMCLLFWHCCPLAVHFSRCFSSFLKDWATQYPANKLPFCLNYPQVISVTNGIVLPRILGVTEDRSKGSRDWSRASKPGCINHLLLQNKPPQNFKTTFI